MLLRVRLPATRMSYASCPFVALSSISMASPKLTMRAFDTLPPEFARKSMPIIPFAVVAVFPIIVQFETVGVV